MNPTCLKCGIEIPLQFRPEDDEYSSMENGLYVRFLDGYGEFIDSYEGPIEVTLCHECAHAMAQFIGLDVHNWHTHVPTALGGTQHPDHHDFAGVSAKVSNMRGVALYHTERGRSLEGVAEKLHVSVAYVERLLALRPDEVWDGNL